MTPDDDDADVDPDDDEGGKLADEGIAGGDDDVLADNC